MMSRPRWAAGWGVWLCPPCAGSPGGPSSRSQQIPMTDVPALAATEPSADRHSQGRGPRAHQNRKGMAASPQDLRQAPDKEQA
jgi:hypothetical protein